MSLGQLSLKHTQGVGWVAWGSSSGTEAGRLEKVADKMTWFSFFKEYQRKKAKGSQVNNGASKWKIIPELGANRKVLNHLQHQTKREKSLGGGGGR